LAMPKASLTSSRDFPSRIIEHLTVPLAIRSFLPPDPKKFAQHAYFKPKTGWTESIERYDELLAVSS
jgi:hypothetical protein